MKQMKIQQRKEYSHRPKAPVSNFFIFYREEAKNLAEIYNVAEGKKLAKLASELWKGMSDEKKKEYDIKAQKYRD